MIEVMKMAFLCSFGGTKGWGHLSRCTALAQEAQSRGWTTILVADGDLSIVFDEAQINYWSKYDCLERYFKIALIQAAFPIMEESIKYV